MVPEEVKRRMLSHNLVSERYQIIDRNLLIKEVNDLIDTTGEFLDCLGYPADLNYYPHFWLLDKTEAYPLYVRSA